MEYLETIAEDVAWHLIDNMKDVPNMTQAQLRKLIFDFLKNQ